MYFNFVFPFNITHCYQSTLLRLDTESKKTFCKGAVKLLDVLVTKSQERSSLKILIVRCCFSLSNVAK